MAIVKSAGGIQTPIGKEVRKVSKDLQSTDAVLFVITEWEAKHAHLIHNIMPNTNIRTFTGRQLPPLEKMTAKYARIVTTRQDVLKLLAPRDAEARDVSVYTFSGSIIPHAGAQWLIIEPLSKLPYDTQYNLLMHQYCAKFHSPELFPNVKFQPHVYHKDGDRPTKAKLCAIADRAILCAVDIETTPFVVGADGDILEHNVITTVGFAYLLEDDSIESHSILMDSYDSWQVVKALCSHPVPKVTHGGKYDTIWCLRWGIPIANLCFDTMHTFHSWYHDLRKALNKVAAFTCRDYIYWKEERKSDGVHERLVYNAKDVHYTLQSMLYMMQHAPKWTATATHRKMRRMHYNVASCALGMNTDAVALLEAKESYQAELDRRLNSLRTITGAEDFNPNSPPQNKILLQILAGKRLKVTGSDKKWMEKVAGLDRFSAFVVGKLQKYKLDSKVMTSYLNARLWQDRVLTSLDVCGTTSDRLASRKADFWHYPDVGRSGKFLKPKEYGWAGMTVKRVARRHVVADEGMVMWSCDLPSAEAYFVWKLSGDPTLGKVLTSDKDYHKFNAHLFFGVPYEKIEDALRTLAKRVNHGSNYNMGNGVLIDTMGIDNILEAQILLGLNPKMTPWDVAGYLLDVFRNTYPYIKGGQGVMVAESWYGKLMDEVSRAGRIETPDGWSKYVFGNPMKDKLVMNNLASVKPQHLSAEYLHQGYDKMWRTLYEPRKFEPLIPIHDEALGQCAKGMEDHYAEKIIEAMTLDFDMGEAGILRIVPDDVKFGNSWYDVH